MDVEVEALQFGVLSDEEILNRSVVELNSLPNKRKNIPTIGSVYDPRLGTVFPGILCSTCGRGPETCGGHIGHIVLKDPVFTTSALPFICKLYECICIRCACLLLPPEFDRNMLRQPTGDQRSTFDGIKQQILAIHTVIQKIQKKNPICPSCSQIQPKKWILYEKVLLRPLWNSDMFENIKAVPTITPTHLYEILQMVSDDDMTLLGFHTIFSRIGSFMHMYYIVPPTLIRPRRSSRSDDDITCRLRMIIKANLMYNCEKTRNLSLLHNIETTHQECEIPPQTWKPCHIRSKVPIVPYQLEEYFELSRQCIGMQDSRYCVKNDLDYGRELQSIRSRFCATRQKRGRLRASILGKRGDYTARGVASPSTHGDPDQVGVPLYVCMHVTIKDRVCSYNYQVLLEMVLNGPNHYPGANFIERNNTVYKLPYFCENGLQFGDIVHRHIVKDDIVIMNRQPSLHRFSMMGYRAYPTHFHTFQLHLAITSAHNLDFDGDEVNMFIPGDMRSRVEVSNLMSVEANAYRNGSLFIGFVQHACLGAYLMTVDPQFVLSSTFVQQLITISRFNNIISPVVCWKGCTGRSLISFLLPTYNGQTPLDKRSLNNAVGIYLQKAFVHKRMHYIGCLTRLFEEFLVQYGSTLSFSDCSVTLPKSLHNKIERAQSYLVGTQGITEKELIYQFERIRDHVGSFTQKTLIDRSSRLMDIIHSGAKGNLTHVTQNAGMIGQQMDSHANRHVSVNSHSVCPLKAKGFVQSSFAKGLGPIEFFHHLTSARIGLVATAVSTSETGYCYRRISKCIEDVRIMNDHTVRDASHNIVATHGLFNTECFTFVNTSRLAYIENISKTYQHPPKCELNNLQRLQNDIVTRRMYTADTTSVCMILPLSLSESIRLYKYKPCTTTNIKQHRKTIYNKVHDACNRLCNQENRNNFPKNTLFEHLYMDYFASYQFIDWDIPSLCVFLQDVERILFQHLCVPGTPIGLIVSQSFSEPLTQMQLNQFHHSGERTEMVGGVVRIKEILNLYKKQVTPSMTIVSKNDCVPRPNDIVQLLLKDTFHCWILCDNGVDTHLSIAKSTIQSDNIIYIRLHREVLIKHECTPRSVNNILQKHYANVFNTVAYTTDLTDESWGLWVQCYTIPVSTSKKKKNDDFCSEISIDLEHIQKSINIIRSSKVLIKGVRNIVDFYTKETQSIQLHNSGRYLEQCKKTIIVTRGSNLAGVCRNIPWVCKENTTTNNIMEVYEELGIDAAYHSIVRELSLVMSSDTTNVSYHHIKLIAQIMCRTGTPCALTFSGLSQSSTSSVKLATFERSLDSFINASTQGHLDQLNGISEAVMIGKQVNVGTGMCNLLSQNEDGNHILISSSHNHNTSKNSKKLQMLHNDIIVSDNKSTCSPDFVNYIVDIGNEIHKSNQMNKRKRKMDEVTKQNDDKQYKRRTTKLNSPFDTKTDVPETVVPTSTFIHGKETFVPWSP